MSHHAHKQVLDRLCANVAERHAKGLVLLAEADASPDMATMKAKLAEALPLLSDTDASMQAIVQTATVMATGEMPAISPEEPVQANPAPAAPSTSAEAVAAAPVSSSNSPAPNEVTGDVVPSDGDASAEDAAATKRRRS